VKRLLVNAALAAVAVVVSTAIGCEKDGDGGLIGVRSAEACTKVDTIECLPKVTFMDTTNEFWTEEVMNGNVVVVNFWATWCKPCKREIPALTQAYEKYKERGLVLLGVMTDEPSDDKLAKFAAEVGMRFPTVRLTDELWHAFNQPPNIPATFVYDRAGNLRKSISGGISYGALDAIIAELVAEPPPAQAAAPATAPSL
jgi:thiol-disulfide isomerase/thioredoxin